ncbi:MAG TPA: class 1 fructose-bisphosphatase [Candidatus Saccharimonadales bacterium]|nr:class 1 fructose-bisphosphatase [Candidatus Saccharimonadales bacterium]
MYTRVTTFTDFLLQSEKEISHASGNFTILMVQLENAAKIIASHVREAGLVDILGTTGRKNVFEEEVQKLDEFSNALLIDMLTGSKQVAALISEEEEQPVIPSPENRGNYIVYFDPLDGSSNIDTNAPIGTIFSIYKKGASLLQKGKKQVAAGYIIYGSSTMLVFTTGKEVNGFTLDPSIGSFLLSHPNMRIPEEGSTYSINEAYFDNYSLGIQNYLHSLKQKPKASLRYIGSLIADVHRTLLKGGIFLYPQDKKHPQGKLRLMIEVNPMAFLVEAAGGVAYKTKGSPLNDQPTDIHERSPLVVGSKQNVLEYVKCRSSRT